ncbi:urease accessory protein UreF, partial [Pseudomonas syringae pv. tagetis]
MNSAWSLLRLASPQLPIGGYSYSQWLEMAVEQAIVVDPQTAGRWIGDQ